MNLNPTDIKNIEKQLNCRLAEISKSVDEKISTISREGAIERGGTDRGDESNHELHTALELNQADRESYEAGLLMQALRRLEQKEFGFCCDCGDNIERGRLLVNPIAKRCFDCQAAHENDFDQRDNTPSL